MDNRVCQECTVGEAMWRCCCNSPQLVCDLCKTNHIEKDKFHCFFCVDQFANDLSELNVVRMLDTARGKLISVTQAEAVLRSRLNEYSDFITRFQTASEDFVKSMREELEKARVEIEFTLEKLRKEVLSTAYCPESLLEESIWDCTQVYESLRFVPDDDLKPMLSFIAGVRTSFNHLNRKFVCRKNLKYSLAVYEKLRLSIYDCKAAVWSPAVTLSKSLPKYSWSVFLSSGSLMHCGGAFSDNIALPNVYEIDTGTGQVTEMERMLSPRIDQGGIADEDVVYMFGGKTTQKQKSAEKYVISERAWKSIGDMKVARINFSPVKAYNAIFICGGFDKSVEQYLPASNEFQLLSIALMETSDTLAFPLPAGNLCMLTKMYLSTWNGAAEFASRRVQTGQFMSTRMLPVVWKDRVYAPGWQGVKWAMCDLSILGDIQNPELARKERRS